MSTPGSIVWHDLTIPNAEIVRDFYEAVVGWKHEPVDMKGYEDYNMISTESGQPAAGICHARGVNASIPPQWLIYVTVADIDASIRACTERGGTVVDGPRAIGGQRFAVVRDPAGAILGLIQ